ncbi:hypothetical protein OA824_18195 [Citrobacter portucalensis]|nr:hypothetical protein [Citrobacter portucalensis]MDN4386575.1 hypothetical protein [Citrobacter portucalensis]MDN4405982.1 hypothetical protein [Citrobacter portucalensis]MDN4445525.1 hypothetical protein [Citrobacter portucalensis]
MKNFTFDSCSFINNEVGIRATDSTEMDFKNTRFEDNGIAIFIYESKDSFLEQNFTRSIPPETLELAAHQLKTADASEYPFILDKFGISKWLKPAADLTTIATNIASLFGK